MKARFSVEASRGLSAGVARDASEEAPCDGCQHTQDDGKEQARGEGNVDAAVLTFVAEVAGQATEKTERAAPDQQAE